MFISGDKKQSERLDRSGERGGDGDGGAPGASGARVAVPGPSSNLDTLLRKTDKLRNGRSRKKLFSRAVVGLMLPGDYYFITFTSARESPGLNQSWENLRKWLRRNYPNGHGSIASQQKEMGLFI